MEQLKMKRYITSLILGSFIIVGVLSSFTKTEKNQRSIKAIHGTVFSMVEGLTTYRAMPTRTTPMGTLDPFVFLNHHGPQVYPENNNGLPFGPHPHRGFETVTFIIDGDLKHRDNTGFESVISAGGVQWMTAGKGIIHAEESSEEFLKKGGNVEIIQLWLNLPKKLKWVAPNYQGIQKGEIPHIKSGDNKTTLNLIAGKWKGKEGPVKSITDIFMSTVNFEKGGTLDIAIDSSRSIFFYVVDGKVSVSGQEVDKRHLVQFTHEGNSLQVIATEKAVVLLGHGKRIGEPIFSKGPFVMNTKEEVKQAWQDYYDGKFGANLPD